MTYLGGTGIMPVPETRPARMAGPPRHLCRKFGLRFSRNASTPSMWSFVPAGRLLVLRLGLELLIQMLVMTDRAVAS